jgi:hypothetical protein
VTKQARRARTERLLAGRLEEVSRALECGRPPRAECVRLVELASAATERAVSLRLLSELQATAIWSDVSARHPVFHDAARRAGVQRAGYSAYE